jgi:hypothetical protein
MASNVLAAPRARYSPSPSGATMLEDLSPSVKMV